MSSIISSMTSKIKFAQSRINCFLNGKIPTIEDIVEDTVIINEAKNKSIKIEVDDEYIINSKGRLTLLNPKCPIHRDRHITENGWTSNQLETITGDKIKIIRQMNICSKCKIVLLPSLEFLKVPYGRITKNGQRYLLELTIEDGLTLRKAKRRLKNTFGLEISVDRIWNLIQSTGMKCNEKMDDIDVDFSGVAAYDEDILLKTAKNVAKLTIIDAVNGYAIKEEVRENKKSDTIKSFLKDGLKNKDLFAIVTDCDLNYPDIIKFNFPGILHQLCVSHFNGIIEGDLRKAAGLNYSKKKILPEKYQKIKGKIHHILSSKNRLIAEKRLYSLFQSDFGDNMEIDSILIKIREYFFNLTHFMEDCRIPKTNNMLESRYSTMEPNYRNNRRFKTLEGANNYSNCQTLFRNFYVIEEGTYVNSSPYSRAGLNHKDDDWLNIIGFGNKLKNYIMKVEKAIFKEIRVNT